MGIGYAQTSSPKTNVQGEKDAKQSQREMNMNTGAIAGRGYLKVRFQIELQWGRSASSFPT